MMIDLHEIKAAAGYFTYVATVTVIVCFVLLAYHGLQ